MKKMENKQVNKLMGESERNCYWSFMNKQYFLQIYAFVQSLVVHLIAFSFLSWMAWDSFRVLRNEQGCAGTPRVLYLVITLCHWHLRLVALQIKAVENTAVPRGPHPPYAYVTLRLQ